MSFLPGGSYYLPLGAGAALIALAQVDPKPQRRVAELIAGGALVLVGVVRIATKLGGSLGFAENPLFQDGGAEYLGAYVGGVPGDIKRIFSDAPPPLGAPESAHLDWLWKNTPSSKSRY